MKKDPGPLTLGVSHFITIGSVQNTPILTHKKHTGTLTLRCIGEMISHPVPQVHEKVNYYKSIVTIGDSPLSSLSSLVYLVPLLYYSHTVRPPHTHHNLLLP